MPAEFAFNKLNTTLITMSPNIPTMTPTNAHLIVVLARLIKSSSPADRRYIEPEIRKAKIPKTPSIPKSHVMIV